MPERSDGPLLLDTHVWIWLIEGDSRRLSRRAIRAIEKASRGGDVLVSAITVWEVAMLEAKGRITLSRPVDDWVRLALSAPGTRLLPIEPQIAIESTRLPGALHGDPADRLLVASARVMEGRLATRDGRIIEYSQSGNVDVLDVT